MKRKRKFFFWIDPIAECISRQKSCLWRENVFGTTLHNNPPWWPYQHHKESKSTVNFIEDLFINAIDKSHHAIYVREDIVKEYIGQGFTLEEVASLLGLSIRTIKSTVKRIKEGGNG